MIVFVHGVPDAAFGNRLNSWVADVGNVAHQDYVWHEFAKIWQTPGDGEEFFESQTKQPLEERAGMYEMMFGIPASDAVEMASAADGAMGRCILELYRSATPNPHADWCPWAPTSAPGLILHATEDPFANAEQAQAVAVQLGAQFATIEGVGHFWPYQGPEAAAAILERFWSSVG